MENRKLQNVHRAIRPLLEKIGLDEKKREIYLALLALKAARASDIAKLAKQSRSHTYIILRKLEEMGLISEVEKGGVLLFVAEPPEKLLQYLQEREKEFRELQNLVEGAIPALKSLSSSTVAAPRVTVLKGIDGMKQVYKDILTQEFVGIYNAQTSIDVFGDNIVTMLFGKNAMLHGRDLLVNNDGAKKYCKAIPPNEEYEVRLLPTTVTFDTDTIIYGDYVVMFAFDADRTIVRIENRKIADGLRAWFDVLWQIATKPKT